MNEGVQTTLRLPEDLNQQLKQAAIQHRRSVHAQILTYIELGLAIEDGTISPVELLALNSPAVMAAIREAKSGDRSQVRRRVLPPG